MNSDFALALHCILLLAHNSKEKITSTQLAEKVSVHPVRVRKVLSLLRKAGYITSKEGVGGGFYIACNPELVRLDEIYRIIDIDVLKPKCHSCSGSCNIGANIENVLIDIFSEADGHLQTFLEKFNLKDILDKLNKN